MLIILECPIIDNIIFDKLIKNNFDMIVEIGIRFMSENKAMLVTILILSLFIRSVSLET